MKQKAHLSFKSFKIASLNNKSKKTIFGGNVTTNDDQTIGGTLQKKSTLDCVTI